MGARLAYRFTSHHDDALDVVQETFAYFAQKFPGFRLEAKLTTFLYPAVKHLSIAADKKRKRFAPNEDDGPEREAPPPETSLESSRAELGVIVANLPESHREVLLLRFVDDQSLEEISQTLSIPIGTVKSRLHHAIGRLREDPTTRRYFFEE